jgi:hypothetical protein
MRIGELRVKTEVAKMWSPGPWKAADLALSCNDKSLADNEQDEYGWTKDEDDDIECQQIRNWKHKHDRFEH